MQTLARLLLLALLPAAPLCSQATEADPQELLRRLPATPSLAVHGSDLRWGGADGFRVRGIAAPGIATVELPAEGEARPEALSVGIGCFFAGEANLATLRGYLDRAKQEGLALDRARFELFALLGPTLTDRRTRNWCLTPFGLVRHEPGPATGLSALAFLQLRTAAGEVRVEVDGAAARETVEQLVACAGRTEEDESEAGPQVPPAFARMLIRSGWLDRYAKGTEALRDAVEAVERLDAHRRFAGEGHTVEFLRSAAGTNGVLVRGPAVSGFAVGLPRARYQDADPRKELVVTFPPGTDPRQDLAGAVTAEVRVGALLLARWSKADGFAAEPVWRRVLPPGRAPELAGIVPPHVLLVGLDGRIDRLVTAHGTLRPARDGSAAEVERFLGEAAAALPDAAHLDLIGEYLFQYVYDSPDPTRPLLVGTEKVHGEIHQTAAQTLATVTGGICRGDCDDLAELYQAILAKQGKLAQMMNLPGHAACGFVREQEGGGFRAYVLQTGTPLEFPGDDVQTAIAAAYRQFYPTVDADALPVAYRFAGENVRSSWVLSHRIYADPDYAETMRDVQRDWHYHTFRQGVVKMEKLVAGGDHDPANYRELAGLARRTGQWQQQLEMVAQARERTKDLEGRIELRLEEVQALIDSKRVAEAVAVAEALRKEELAAVPKGEAGLGGVEQHLRLAATLLAHDAAPEAALEVLRSLAGPVFQHIQGLARFVHSERFDRKAFLNAPELAYLRRVLSSYCETTLRVQDLLRGQDSQATRTQQVLVSTWLDFLAFHDVVAKGEELSRYAAVGRLYAIQSGREKLWQELDAAEPPAKADIDHRRRDGETRARDLPWIKIAVPYWVGEILTMLLADRPLDQDVLVQLHERMLSALRQADALGVLGEFDRRSAATCSLYVAMIRGEKDRVRELFRAVKALGDKHWQDDATEAFGMVAPFVDGERFAAMLAIWHEEVHHKPAYLQIVWDSFVRGAKEHARHAAEFAVRAFPDEKAFAEERASLEEQMRR